MVKYTFISSFEKGHMGMLNLICAAKSCARKISKRGCVISSERKTIEGRKENIK
jgi:hypothetical protein